MTRSGHQQRASRAAIRGAAAARPALLGLPLLLLAACAAVGPDYRQPRIALPAAYDGDHPPSGPAPDGAAGDGGGLGAAWWRAFHDAALDDLIGRAVSGSLDLRTAISRIREARGLAVIAGAAEDPTLAANAQASRTHLSANGGLGELAGAFTAGTPGGGGIPGGIAVPGLDLNLYQLGLDASWQIDVFGGTRRTVEAAVARAQAAVWSACDVLLSLEAEVATSYVTVRLLAGEVALAEQQGERSRRTLLLDAQRLDSGLGDIRAVERSRSSRAAALAQLADLRSRLAAARHALAVLLGDAPEAPIPELAAAAAPPVPPALTAGLPSELLRRRPDIRSAERRLAATSADIGVATADLYPKIDLIASLELVSASLGSLFSWRRSYQYTGAAGLSWPIFSGGAIRANIMVTRERDIQALLAYRTAILAALRDAEDALTRSRRDGERRLALHHALDASLRAYGVAQDRQRAGLADEGEMLAAEGDALAARDLALSSDAAIALDAIQLVKAVGGGWSGQEEAAPAAPP